MGILAIDIQPFMGPTTHLQGKVTMLKEEAKVRGSEESGVHGCMCIWRVRVV
jgi:hypothetical protein